MLAGKASPARAAVANVTGGHSLLPFLYFTRTISRGYPRSPDTNHGEHTRHHRGGRPRDRDIRENGSARREKPQTSSQRPKLSSIPFERIPARQDPYTELELEGSTITPNERKAFESLFTLRAKPQVAQPGENEAPTSRTAPGAFPNSLGKTTAPDGKPKPELPPALQAILKEIQTTDSGEDSQIAGAVGHVSDHKIQPSTMTAAASKELNTISKAMDTAKTDVQVWEILRSQVLTHLTMAGESEVSEDVLKNATREMHDSAEKGIAHTAASSRMQTLAQTLPEHLVRTLRRLLSDFPASTLPLSLLPTLKSLGPAAFALGASTSLYNSHLRLLYERYTDLHAIVDVLGEMEEGAHEADGETLELLDDILIYAHQAEHGEHGAGVQLLWKMERMQGPLMRIVEARKALIHKLEEKALRLARQQDVTGLATGTELRA